MLKAAKAYLSTQVGTASKGDLLLMLYDTAIKHLKLAKTKIEEKDYAAKGVLITKAITIVSELQESLNKEQGGDVTKNLFQVYFFCNAKLLQANMQMNPALVEEVIGILGGLRQAFAQIIPMHEGNSTASTHSPFAEGGKAPAGEAPPVPRDTAPEEAPQPADAAGEPQEGEAAQPVAEETAPAAPAQTAPVQTARFRAANAYANSR